MPGKVKVKIISGKNLPVMDRSSDTTDAYVEIKLGNTTYKTDVCRRTLHPQWNTDWYRFEVDDSELQDEPLQIRLMDHDTYSANDAIGKVYLNLNPLLLPVAGQLAVGDNNPHHEISGWIPVYDTMHGIRGEVNVTVKVELFSDFNRFRQSSCGVHFFNSPTIPQGYHAKVINGFVEELIVDDDPEYQWIDKIRTPRASNEARQTLFFKLSGELQRKIGVKALGLGGNAVIGYRQCFDIEGESGIVARGIGTAVTLMKAYNTSNVVPEAKDENVESYLKFVGNGKSFSLCATAPSHIPFSLFDPISNLNNSQPCVSQLTTSHHVTLQSNEMSVSNPNLYQRHNIKELLDQEERRDKSVMSRRFKKFRHSQKSLSKKMIALKAKLNDSIGEQTDDMQGRNIDKRKLFKRTASDSSAMAEILARSVMRATTSLTCILEDQPHFPNENESVVKLEPEAKLLNRSESEASGFVEVASDAQSCSSSDSSSSCSYYEYQDYTNVNNDVETLSNIITNVEKLQRCLSRDGLHKQYSLPSIPTRGFSLSSLDSFSQLDRSDQLHMNSSGNRSVQSIFNIVSNISNYGNSDSKFVNQKRRSSDVYDSTLSQANIYSHRQQKSEKFYDINLSDEPIGNLSDNSQNFLENSTEILSHKNQAVTHLFKDRVQPKEVSLSDAVSRVPNIIGHDNLSDRKQEEWKFPLNERFQHVENSFCQLKQDSSVVNLEASSSTVNTSLASIPAYEHMTGTSKSDIESEFEFPCIKDAHWKHNFASEKYNQWVKHIETGSQGIVKTALQTMLIERADLLGTDSLNTTSDVIAKVHHADKANSKTFHQLGGKEIDPKGIIKTALQTMLIERADILATPEITELKTEQLDQEKYVQLTASGHDKDVNTKGIVNTALETMPIEKANMLSSAPDNTLQTGAVDVNEKHVDLGNESGGHGRHIEHSDDIRTIAEVTLDSVNIQPKKMVRTAMQTMLLDKFNILGTYTPPSSPNLLNDEPNPGRSRAFTFNIGEYVRKSIPKSYSSISLGDQHKEVETVLGMPFVSLSSLKSDNDKFTNQRTPVLPQDGLLQKPVSEKLTPHRKMFRFLSLKTTEHQQNTNIFPGLRTESQQSILDDFKSDVIHQNVLSRMFHARFHEKPINDKETQTSNEVLFCQKLVQNSDVSSSPNNASVTDMLIPPLKPPSSVDLASGDFIAHSKTKSACITSHHSSPAQERQDQNGGDKKEHIPDPAVRTSQSPVKVNYMVPLHRRSSDSDLSITPKDQEETENSNCEKCLSGVEWVKVSTCVCRALKTAISSVCYCNKRFLGNSLTGSDKSMGNAAAYFMRNNYLRRGQVNPEHFDLLEYPFLTMTKFPSRFIIQIGGSISARSVKLLERILNVDEPESRDIWWSEIRMEIRSHARSLNCNAVLGYTELTSICDDVCVLSACGTAAVIDFNSPSGDEDNFSNVQLIHKNVERDKQANSQTRTLHDSPDHRLHSTHYCAVTHLPYDEKTVPVKAKVTKCPICLKAKVPEVIIATIEPPESVPTVGKGCFIESHVSRVLKDLRGEAIAKEISDGLPFLEYELHRLLVNKLKIKGMNAIFSLKIRITVGEKLLVGVATGTAVYSSCLPTPDLPVLVTGKLSDEKVVADLQEMLSQTVKKNKEIYQIKDGNQAQKALSDEDSDTEQAPLDISCGNKDCCILEMDDPEDAEVLRLLMQEKIPDGIHVVSTESVPGLEDLEIVKNLQMFTQIYRAKLPPPYDLQKHFVRLLQSIYFKLRRMVPCALCDLQFRIDIPEPDEIQLCVIGMALGLGKKAEKVKSTIALTKPEEDLIFKLDDYHSQDPTQPSTSKANQANQKYRNNRSPSKYRSQSLKQRHIPFKERHGVDITPLSYVPGGTIEQYLGNINFFFIRETTSIREEGGLSGFIHSFVTEVLAIVRSHVTALGGNALVAFFMTECVLNHNLHKNQGQCLINVGGDVVSVAYFKDEA